MLCVLCVLRLLLRALCRAANAVPTTNAVLAATDLLRGRARRGASDYGTALTLPPPPAAACGAPRFEFQVRFPPGQTDQHSAQPATGQGDRSRHGQGKCTGGLGRSKLLAQPGQANAHTAPCSCSRHKVWRRRLQTLEPPAACHNIILDEPIHSPPACCHRAPPHTQNNDTLLELVAITNPLTREAQRMSQVGALVAGQPSACWGAAAILRPR
jgi:hypothetical protein